MADQPNQYEDRISDSLIAAIESRTGKTVKKLTVHYVDKTQDTIAADAREARQDARRAERLARRQERIDNALARNLSFDPADGHSDRDDHGDR